MNSLQFKQVAFAIIIIAQIVLGMASVQATESECGETVYPNQKFSKYKNVAIVSRPKSSVFGGVAASKLLQTFVNEGIYNVVERGAIDSILLEHGISSTGFIDPRTYKEMGRVMGVDALIIVTDLNPNVTSSELPYVQPVVEVRFVDVETGQILLTDIPKNEGGTYRIHIFAEFVASVFPHRKCCGEWEDVWHGSRKMQIRSCARELLSSREAIDQFKEERRHWMYE
jgi:hypothetical protein